MTVLLIAVTLYIGTTLIQKAARAGLTLYETAMLIAREDYDVRYSIYVYIWYMCTCISRQL
jgi:hypothetical protein